MNKIGRFLTGSLLLLVLAGTFVSTGCAVHSAGMTLPNPYYLEDRVEYFPPGHKFPFANEASQLDGNRVETVR